jgi:hypothetical protein
MVHAARSRLAWGLAFAIAFIAPRAAKADTDACVAPKINVVVPPGPQWQSATVELTERLRGLPDLDKCAHVLVRPSGLGVIVQITTSDGREASRQVGSEAELLHVAEALLVLPPEPARAIAEPSPLEVPPRESRPAALEAATHVELGAGASLRFGGGPIYAGGGVAGFAQFAQGGWLLAVSGRWDIADAFISEPTPTDFSMQSTAVGVGVGRRLELGSADLDTVIGPSIVLEGQEADDGNRDIHGASADFRVAFAVRISGPRASSVRPYATGEFEGSPARLRTQKFIDRSLPPLPWWSSGISVGVLWGAR